MKISIIGSSGQLGFDLVKELSQNHKVQKLTHNDVEVTSIDSLQAAIGPFKPDWIINTAAYHNVTLCHENPAKAFKVNADGAKNVAEVANHINAKTLYFSTDYVFSGEKQFSETYSEVDSPSPINVYGQSKLRGEEITLEYGENNVVARISSVFGYAGSSGKGGNFVESIVKKLASGERPEVVSSNLMSPTYTASAAHLTRRLIEEQFSKVIHLSNTGQASWFEFALFISELMGMPGSVSPTKEMGPSEPYRPLNSALDNSLAANLGQVAEWQDALLMYMKEKGHI